MSDRQYMVELLDLVASMSVDDLPAPIHVQWDKNAEPRLTVQVATADVDVWFKSTIVDWTSTETLDGTALHCRYVGHLTGSTTRLALIHVRCGVLVSTWTLAQQTDLTYEEAEAWLAEFPDLTIEQQHAYWTEMRDRGADTDLLPEPGCLSCQDIYNPAREGAEGHCGICCKTAVPA